MSLGPEIYKLWLMYGGLLFFDYSFSRVLWVLKCTDISVMINRGHYPFLKVYILKWVSDPVIYKFQLMMGVYYFSNWCIFDNDFGSGIYININY